MCFYEETIKTAKIELNQFDGFKLILSKIEHVEKLHPEWFIHFRYGPYQYPKDYMNYERFWANVGEVILKKIFPDMSNHLIKE